MVKHPPTVWETRVQSLGPENLPEKERQPTPVFLPGKSLGRRSLVGYSPWGCKESDRTEPLHFHAPPKAGWRGWESPWAPCAPSHGVGVGADSAPRIDGSVQAAMLKCTCLPSYLPLPLSAAQCQPASTQGPSSCVTLEHSPVPADLLRSTWTILLPSLTAAPLRTGGGFLQVGSWEHLPSLWVMRM